MHPTSRKRLLRTAWRPWASISFCSKAVTIFATVPRSGCTTAVRRSSKSLPSTWLDKSLWILLLIREFGKIKFYIIHELFVILFDAYDIHLRIVNMIYLVCGLCKAQWVYLVGRTTTSYCRTWPSWPLKCLLFILQAICRTSCGFKSKRKVCTSFGKLCVSIVASVAGSFTNKGTREAIWRLAKAETFVPLALWFLCPSGWLWISMVKTLASSCKSTAWSWCGRTQS